MNYVWRDYHPEAMQYIKSWLDKSAVDSTGLDEGFRVFYEYWANEDGFAVGENFWCKVVFDNGTAFAVVAFCLQEDAILIQEMIVHPEKRGQGKGSKLLKELLQSREIVGFAIQKSKAVIFPGNTASKRAFENAGFFHHHIHEDAGGVSIHYVYERNRAE